MKRGGVPRCIIRDRPGCVNVLAVLIVECAIADHRCEQPGGTVTLRGHLDSLPKETQRAIRELSEDLGAGRTAKLQELFRGQGARSPLVAWAPGMQDLQNPLIEKFMEQCLELSDKNGLLRIDDFRLADFASMSDWMMVLAVEDEGRQFRYTHYGPAIREHFGRDMTGQTTLDFDNHISLFFTALYGAVSHRGIPVLSEHEPPAQVFVSSWRRLIVPLFDDVGHVVAFAAINVPMNELRAGLETIPDPVFVVDAEGIVRYANHEARELFPKAELASGRQDFEALTGVSLEETDPPIELLGRRCVLDSQELMLLDTMLVDMQLTISAALHREHAFYIIVLRLSPP